MDCVDIATLPMEKSLEVYLKYYHNPNLQEDYLEFKIANRDVLHGIYQHYPTAPIYLKKMTRVEDGIWNVVLQKGDILNADRLLLIKNRRCVGPIVEIMVNLRFLKHNQALQLVVFSDRLDGARLADQVTSRGYSISDTIYEQGYVYSVRITNSHKMGGINHG